jgi:hypothetical protein
VKLTWHTKSATPEHQKQPFPITVQDAFF